MTKPVDFYAVEEALSNTAEPEHHESAASEGYEDFFSEEKESSGSHVKHQSQDRQTSRHKKRFSLKPLKFWDKKKAVDEASHTK